MKAWSVTGIYASNTSLSCFAILALTTCLAGISIRAPVAGLRPMRFFTLLHHQLRDPREHELATPQQLLLGQLLQLVEELAGLRTLDAVSTGHNTQPLVTAALLASDDHLPFVLRLIELLATT